MSDRSLRILVIKLGALGDFVQALGPIASIRRHHADDHVVLLTTKPFESLARASGYADEIWLDDRPPPLALRRWLALRKRLRAGRFDRVYDLQTANRTSWYFRLFWPGPWPEWSGIAPGCSHPHANPARNAMHTIDRQAEQLRLAGIAETSLPDLTWIHANIDRFQLAKPYALVIPGAAPHRPAKRWPLERFAALVRTLAAKDLDVAILGAAADSPLGQALASASPRARDLTGQTSLEEVAALAREATVAIGNDTGPMHLIAAAGCPSLVLFSHESDPALCAPRGRRMAILRCQNLADLGAEEVLAALPLREVGD